MEIRVTVVKGGADVEEWCLLKFVQPVQRLGVV